jgi:hypothetical protein
MFDTAYISENLPIGPAEAAAIADVWHGRLGETATRSHYVRGAERLWLGAELQRVSADRFGVRQVPGILWVHGLPVRVELEMSVWTSGVTTMAIRPRGRFSIAGPGYVEAAYRAVRDIARCLMETKESVETKQASYRTVAETVSERTFAWPTLADETPMRPTVTAGGGHRWAQSTVGVH